MLKPEVSDKDHASGPSKAPVTLVEFGDYECPHCGRAYPIIKDIQQTMGKQLRFVFRNFPLNESHPHAFMAAVAAEAAAKQDKFWEMHDIIYEHQDSLEMDDLLDYAKQLGLDIRQFAKDIQDKSTSGKVEHDFDSGLRSGVNGTPTFFINGKRYDGDWENDLAQRLADSF
ncbi:MAG TPA: thioredoxin domain-containing protein [Chitinophagaceae bacterium]|nr:thioredoxin domain-containing protein [Chitinophagaceae bacterium]